MTTRPNLRRFAKYERLGGYHWDWADPSSRNYAPAAHARYRVLADHVDERGSLLDLGCGDGVMMSFCDRVEGPIVGVDRERGALNLARARLPTGHQLVLGDSTALPLGAESFQTVVLADVIEHLEEPEACLREVTRVLATDGRLLVTTPQWRPGRMWDPEHHVKEYRPDEFEALLTPHFREVAVSYFISRFWWGVRKRLGKAFVRALARHAFNPFLRSGQRPERFVHMLAVCRGPYSGVESDSPAPPTTSASSARREAEPAPMTDPGASSSG